MMPYLGHVGLALATAIASWTGVIIMAVLLAREGRLRLSALSALWPILGAALVMGAVIELVDYASAAYFDGLILGQFMSLVILVTLGLGSYFGLSFWLGTIPPFLFRKRA